MKIQYYKNDVDCGLIFLPNNLFKGLTSRYAKVRNKNHEKLFDILKQFHPETGEYGINYTAPFVWTGKKSFKF
jgi:hypothetical protein